MENISDKISPMTLAAAMALGGGSDPSATVYYPAGSVTFENLPSLETAEVGAVYDVTDAFTSTVDFKDGGGKDYPAGTDVAIVNVGTVSSPVLKYNCLSGFVDLSNYVEKVEGKGLSTNDYTNDDKQIVTNSPINGTVTGTAISISDATDARVQSLVIKGRSEVSSGNISSVGDSGLAVTIAQLGQTSRKLTLTTGLPLLSVGNVYDEIDLAKGVVIKRCGYADLSSFTWTKQEYDNMYTFTTPNIEVDNIKAPANNSDVASIVCGVYDTRAVTSIYDGTYNNAIGLSSGKYFRICDTTVSDTTELSAKLEGKILVYELATPVIIPLNAAELTSWAKFRTFEGANGISATDSPNMDVTYIKNTHNGKALAAAMELNGNDGTNTDMTRTTLYFNDWATTAANTIELVDSYKNYDALEFTLLRTASNDICPLEHIITVEAIEHVFTGKNVALVLPFHGSDFICYYVTSDTLLTKVTSGGMVLAIAKIVGVKYAEEAVNIVSWQNGTDEEIKAMLLAAEMGKIDLNDYWSIGDERTVHLSAMSAMSPLTDTHVEQDVTFVLMDTGAHSGYKFADDTPVNFVVGMKQCLKSRGKWNSTTTSSGSWNSCERRTWCNSTFYNSLPASIKPIFKQFKTVTASEYNSDTLTTSTDYFALFAEKEIYGSATYSRTAEANALTQIEYYKTAANRKKKGGTMSMMWGHRSPQADVSNYFTMTDNDNSGSAIIDRANSSVGLSMFGCI